MGSNIHTVDIQGVSGEMIDVECRILHGFPSFSIVGLASATVLESKERIRASFDSLGIRLPTGRIIVNMIPGDRKKHGTHWDLPIAVSLLSAMGQVDSKRSADFAFIGELSLEGQLQRIQNAQALVIALVEHGYTRIVLPAGNLRDCSDISGASLYPIRALGELFEHLRGGASLASISGKSAQSLPNDSTPDFGELFGQLPLKRAMQVAAAGRHSILMIGPPGVGKTMAVQCFMGILPDLDEEALMSRRRIYSSAGLKEPELYSSRPILRRPNHTITPIGLLGGGVPVRPGEVTLADHGVLFMDELPAYPQRLLERLRLPMETGEVGITNGRCRLKLPASFRFVASMNPCPCGHYGDPRRACTCTPNAVERYLNRLSKPLLDRIDMCIEVGYPDMSAEDGVGSESLREDIYSALDRQFVRYRETPFRYNGDASKAFKRDNYKFSAAGLACLDRFCETHALSVRRRIKLTLLAQTAADLDGCASITESAVLEAVSYHQSEYKYWKK